MRTDPVTTPLHDAMAPHRGGHRCIDGGWWNDAVRPDQSCPQRRLMLQAVDAALTLGEQPHDAAHDDTAATAVAEGMTGLTLADLPPEEAAGWLHTGRLAIEALAAYLDRDPAREARVAATLARLGEREAAT